MLRRNSKAFSLLELLAVVTLIGILAVVIVPRISVQAFDAKTKVCDQYRRDINSAIEQYYMDKGTFPTTPSDLVPDYYPDTVPVCPATGNPYTIDPTANRVLQHAHGS